MEIRLTIREVTRPIELTGHFHAVDDDAAAIRLHFSREPSRHDFGIFWMPPDRLMIGARVKLELDLLARHSG